jgi:hypothetical protein
VSDLLSAASLFLAVLGLLYSAWYDEIGAALSIVPKEFKADRVAQIAKVKGVYRSRSIPLAGASLIIVLSLLQPLFRLLSEACATWKDLGWQAAVTYDAVKTPFALVCVATAAFAIHTGSLARKLYGKLRVLERQDRSAV